jgi:multidrug efflux pump subunit AcrA (membrane-fusion protein)
VVGQKADVLISEGATTLEGEVVAIPRSLDTKTGLGDMRILLTPNGSSDTAFSAVPIGAFGHARIHAKPIGDALSIPSTALRGAALDGAEVAVCKDGKTTLQKIVLGYRDETRAEVVSGLSVGDHVAVTDVLGLGEGTPIAESAPSPASLSPASASAAPVTSESAKP